MIDIEPYFEGEENVDEAYLQIPFNIGVMGIIRRSTQPLYRSLSDPRWDTHRRHGRDHTKDRK